ARHMGKLPDLHAITEKGTRQKAAELGTAGDFYGLPIGETVLGRKGLFTSVEDLMVAIWGPRTGKTTSLAVPWILAAPGAVVATSNKRDLWDTTSQLRRDRFGTVWGFDPQGIAEQKPTWWWNPLSYVVDGATAATLAGHFASGSRAGLAPGDAHPDPAAEDLLAAFFLAAASGRFSITRVLDWLTSPDKDAPEAVGLLERAGFPAIARSLQGTLHITNKQRDGIFGTASQMVACLKNEKFVPWITRVSAFDARPQFDPHAFARSRDTLYLMSKEGKGTATPIVTALTAATIEAAEQYATGQPGGRLTVPLVGVLDEAANVCRWAELPNLYSHFGSRGILLITILQSWSQGCDVWGESGMKKLWSAANAKSYGGGVDEIGFLKDFSDLIGPYEHVTLSSSSGPGGRTNQVGATSEPILDASDLAAWPRGRAIVKASGMPAVLVRTVPWMAGPHAQAVRDGLAQATHRPDAPTSDDNPWLTKGNAA
ncbi:type IV secretory system conjugative DNA transfer family protein, partial [Streptomyces bacillaris]|uniref:type IV secretory system conjugative DNA transfer family protein n=1 Tax=Streptomyces bacillaris TaxID=68179 RepID=UPI0036DE4F1D